MIDRTPEYKKDVGVGRKPRRAHYAILGAVCALVIGVYAWSAKSGWLELSSSSAANTYYNLLVQGFRAGQLNLKREVPAGLAQLADPYDPMANEPYRSRDGYPLHDMSYYQGKLYLYFGVTPALVLLWPWYELTKHYLLHRDAVLIFCTVGFLTGAGLLVGLWQRYFLEVRVGVLGAGILALGLAAGTPLLLARSDVYEVAISCGYALTMLALTAICRAMHEPKRRCWWLVAASVAYGLALGARPSLLFGAVILLVPVVMAWRETAEPGRRRRGWILLLAATGPIVLIGLGLMLYNTLRFDNPLEFGQSYQLAADRQDMMQHFSLRYLWFNFRVYFLEPARWSGRFPFVYDIAAPPLPAGSAGVEHPFGILANIPLVWVALAVALAWRGRLAKARSTLRYFLAALLLLFGIGALTLGLYCYAMARYEVEFLPALVLLTVLGALGLDRALAGWPLWRRVTRWGGGLLLASSVAFNLLARFTLHAETQLNLGDIAFQEGQVNEAINHYQKALELQPDFAVAHGNLGVALFEQGKVAEAIEHQEQVLRLRPDDAQAHYNWGKAMILQGKLEEAVDHFAKAVRIVPHDPKAHYYWGNTLARQSKLDEAIAHYTEAVKLQPDYAEAHFSWGSALVLRGKLEEAQMHLMEALRFKPGYVEAHYNLGELLVLQGNMDQAIMHYMEVLRINPEYAEGHYNLACALARQKKLSDAVTHFSAALKSRPDYAAAANDLAWILATETNNVIRDVDEAIRLAVRACELTANQIAGYLDTLGVAYSEAGRFKEAVEVTERAVAVASASGDKTMGTRIASRLEHYRAGRAYHAITGGSGF